MTTDDHIEQSPRGVPWGQLIAGGIVGGISLWMIALHLSGAAPSAMLAGVAATYEGWRDWLMTPLERWLQIKLSPVDRDTLAFDIVMIGAIVRTALRYPTMWGALLFILWWALLPVSTLFAFLAFPDFWVLRWRGVEYSIRIVAVFSALVVVGTPIAGIIGKIMEPVRELDDLLSPPAMFALWNAIAIAALAGGLLVVDWAARS
jgi:hypothetical protein